MANRNYPKNSTSTNAIPFDNPITYIPPLTVSGPVTFTKVTTGAQAGYGAMREVTADGTNIPDVSAFASVGTGTYDNTAGVVNLFTFFYTGSRYVVSINPISGTGTGGGGGDTTPPSTTSVSVENAEPNNVLIAYGETLDSGSVPSTSAYTVTVNGTTRTISSVAITGANVKVTFGGAAVISTDTITLDYVVPGTNPIQDVAGNDAAALTGVTASNNVSGTFTWVDLTYAIQQNVAVTSNVWTPTTNAGWNQKGCDDLKLANGNDGAVIQQMQSDAQYAVVGFQVSHAMPGSVDGSTYSTCKVGAYLSSSGAVYKIVDGTETLISGLTLSAGDWVGVFRIGGVWKLRTSSDKTTWTDRATLSPSSFTGIDVYPVLYLYTSSAGAKCYNPQGSGLS
jgi:hypothetical protein